MKILFFLIFLFPQILSANLNIAPPNVSIGGTRGIKAVFVDFKSAVYHIEYNLKKRIVRVRTEITFDSKEKGFPIFDLIPNPSSIKLNGNLTKSQIIDVKETKFRVIQRLAEIGENLLIIESKIDKNVKWSLRGVRTAFWMSDLSKRNFLEQYLPTNLEFDQYPSRFEISLTGKNKKHDVFTNGEMIGSGNKFTIKFPSHFNASSYFFHMVPKKRFKIIRKTFNSIDGREIPVTIYGYGNNNDHLVKTMSTLKELENDYGPWPHPLVLVYAAGRGGMEYNGATITSMRALGHELTHSYFARGVIPAGGNAGWVDEAIASWRDNNYIQADQAQLTRTKMAGHSPYRRTTDGAAYTAGMKFLAHLDKKFEDQGGLKAFLKIYKENWLFRPFFTQNFQKDLETHFNENLSALFNKYIYGKEGVSTRIIIPKNPHHPKLSERELESLL